MPSIIATCRKCEARVLVEGCDALPGACERCGCPFWTYFRLTTPGWILTNYDRAFLIRECGIRPE